MPNGRNRCDIRLVGRSLCCAPAPATNTGDTIQKQSLQSEAGRGPPCATGRGWRWTHAGARPSLEILARPATSTVLPGPLTTTRAGCWRRNGRRGGHLVAGGLTQRCPLSRTRWRPCSLHHAAPDSVRRGMCQSCSRPVAPRERAAALETDWLVTSAESDTGWLNTPVAASGPEFAGAA